MVEIEFYDYTLEDGDTRVEITHTDEGFSGDYNPDDSEDMRLLRFYVQRKVEGLWEDMDDASYCTLIPIDIPRTQVERMAEIIMLNVKGKSNIKRICEDLSWLNVKDLSDNA